MDKLMSSIWFVRIAALVVAILLFISVNFELNSNKKSLSFSTAPDIDTVTIQNVPVEVYYDTENLVVSGIPDSVNVTLKGAKSLLTAAKNQRDFKVYVDLSDPNITLGKRMATLKVSNLNDKLAATINPKVVEVNIQEKVTKEFPVDVEYNRSALEDGYLVNQPTVNPKMVKVTGAKETIDQISYVKAILNLEKGVNQTVNEEATVQALDRDLNKLDVTIEPVNVDVELKVAIPKKTVTINPVQKGKVQDGIHIKSISVDPKTVTLYGAEDVLKQIASLNLDVDVSSITDNTEMELTLPKPSKVKKMSTDKVKVKIDVEKDKQANTASKKLNSLLIGIKKVQNQSVDIHPASTNITLFGQNQVLKNVTANDVKVSVDVSKLQTGKHNVQLSVQAPSNINWELSSPIATVSITQKAAL